MSKTNKSTDIYDRYGMSRIIVDNDNLIDLDNPTNDEEIKNLIETAYEFADEQSPTGSRSPDDVNLLENKRKELKQMLSEMEEEKSQNQMNRESWEAHAARTQKRIRDDVKEDRSKQMTRLQEALKDPNIKDILLKVMTRRLTPDKAFHAIKANPGLNQEMMSLTLKGPGTGSGTGKKGGKSRVFRRKNKKTTSKSKRNARRTQRHRKSSTRRSTRK